MRAANRRTDVAIQARIKAFLAGDMDTLVERYIASHRALLRRREKARSRRTPPSDARTAPDGTQAASERARRDRLVKSKIRDGRVGDAKRAALSHGIAPPDDPAVQSSARAKYPERNHMPPHDRGT